MTDREIITRIIDFGEQHLYEEIVRRHSGAVYAAALATAHDAVIAEEAVQQAFIKAYENIERWRGGISIAPYLKMIAHNTALTLLAERARHRATPIEGVQVVADEEFSLAHEERLNALAAALTHLSEQEREIVELFYWQHLRTAEIAERTALSESNVLVKLHRIRNKLKEMINYEE